MLSATNRGGIRASIKQWSQRKSIPDEVLNDFIELALNKANRLLRIPPLEKSTDMPISSTGYAQLPGDYVEAKEVYFPYNGYNIMLERKSIIEVDALSNLSTAGEGIPRIFGRSSNYLKVAPWNLGDEEVLSMYYFAALPPLSTDLSTNWFTVYAPEVLLYGALSELSDYVRDNEGIQLWEAKFKDVLRTLQGMEDRAEWSGSTIAVTMQGSTLRRR